MLPYLVTFINFVMHEDHKEKTLTDYCKASKYKLAAESIKAWVFEVRYSTWNNANELKSKYRNASVISSKRVVFNIKGNDYRLIVDIEYKLKIVFIEKIGISACSCEFTSNCRIYIYLLMGPKIKFALDLFCK